MHKKFPAFLEILKRLSWQEIQIKLRKLWCLEKMVFDQVSSTLIRLTSGHSSPARDVSKRSRPLTLKLTSSEQAVF
jgi:hypothetical protein